MLLSIVFPYYRNPRMLARQLRIMATEWPDSLKASVEVIIVDDGSPEPAAIEVEHAPAGLPFLSLYRITEDRPWHQHGARNLGAHVATSPWLLMTDMDHVIPADTLAFVLDAIAADVAREVVLTFARRDAPSDQPWKADHWTCMNVTRNASGLAKPHVNSFAVPRSVYWSVGGYDEDYCGLYGTDKLFRRRLFDRFPSVALSLPLIRVSRECIPDASTRDFPRKEGREPGEKKAVALAKEARGEADVIKTLQFPWERLK